MPKLAILLSTEDSIFEHGTIYNRLWMWKKVKCKRKLNAKESQMQNVFHSFTETFVKYSTL